MHSIFFRTIFISAFLFAACRSGEKLRLRLNLEQGRTYRYTMKEDSETEIRQGSPAVSSASQRTYRMEVVKDSSGIKTLKTTIERLVMRMTLPNGILEIDTELPFTDTSSQPDPMEVTRGMFHALKGTSFFLRVNEEGKVIEVSGLQEMGEAMLKGMRLDENIRPMVQQSFAQQFNETTMKQALSQVFEIFPPSEIKKGDTWERTVSLPSIQMNVHTVYRVKDISEGKVVLEADSDLDMSGSRGTQKSRYVLDAASGFILSGSYEQNIDQPVKMKSRGKITGTIN